MVWDCEGEDIYSEELPFENFNNVTSGNGLKLFNGDPAGKLLNAESGLEVWGD